MDTETKIAFEKLEQKMHEGFGEMHQGFGEMHRGFEKVREEFEGVRQEFEGVRQEFKKVRQEMKDGLQETTKNLTDFIVFETSHLKKQMDEQFEETRGRIGVLYEHVDGFINLHKTLDMELAATRLQQGRLEDRVSNLEAKA